MINKWEHLLELTLVDFRTRLKEIGEKTHTKFVAGNGEWSVNFDEDSWWLLTSDGLVSTVDYVDYDDINNCFNGGLTNTNLEAEYYEDVEYEELVVLQKSYQEACTLYYAIIQEAFEIDAVVNNKVSILCWI